MEKQRRDLPLPNKQIKTIVIEPVGGCMTCPKEYPLEFRDTLSYREYRITGTCQKCQDKIFGKSYK